MVSGYNRKKKKDAIFLNVEPAPDNIITRKYSSGILSHIHNGHVVGGRDRASVITLNSAKLNHFIPSVFYDNTAPILWFLFLTGIMPMVRKSPKKAEFNIRSWPFIYSVVFAISLTFTYSLQGYKFKFATKIKDNLKREEMRTPKDIVNIYNRKKKRNAVFLNVKPTLNNAIRKYSNGILDQMHNGYGKKITAGRDRISVTTLNAINQHKLLNIFYRNVGPIRWSLSLMGALPMARSGPGTSRFIARSTNFAYCVVMFIFLALYVAYVANNRIMIVASLSGPFEEAVIAYLFLVNLLPMLMIPIMWWETRKICVLMNDWDDFEILYYQIAGHSVPLNLRRKAQNIAIALPILSILSVVVTHVTMSDFHLVQIIPYCILDNITAMLGAWWYFICEAISETANILGERFQKALRHIGPAGMVADYRALWLRLSKLTRDTGTATCYTFTFLNLYLFFIITLSIYGLMSQLSAGFGTKDIGLAVTALWNICLLFFICDQAHNASNNVRTNFQKKLLMVELNWMNSDAQTEINMFLRATDMNQSNINCGGFFDVNRNLYKGLLTTMVTYLVVLLQFQISIPDDTPGGATNVSLYDAITMMAADDYEDSGEKDVVTSTTTTTTPLPTTLRPRAGTNAAPAKGRRG